MQRQDRATIAIFLIFCIMISPLTSIVYANQEDSLTSTIHSNWLGDENHGYIVKFNRAPTAEELGEIRINAFHQMTQGIENETNYVEGGGLIPEFWSEGYHWGGISSQVSIFLNKRFSDKFSYNIEGKAVMAKTNIPVVGGSFDLPNISAHILVGISFSI